MKLGLRQGISTHVYPRGIFLPFPESWSLLHFASGRWPEDIMPPFGGHKTLEQRSFLAVTYAETKCVKTTLDLYQLKWPDEPRPSKNAPKRQLTKLKKHGSLAYLYPQEIKKRGFFCMIRNLCQLLSIYLLKYSPFCSLVVAF